MTSKVKKLGVSLNNQSVYGVDELLTDIGLWARKNGYINDIFVVFENLDLAEKLYKVIRESKETVIKNRIEENVKLKPYQKVYDVNGNAYLTEANDIIELKESHNNDFYGTDSKGNEWVKAYVGGEAYWFYAYSDKTHIMQGYDYKDNGFDNYIKNGNPAVLHKNQIRNPEVLDNIENWLHHGEDRYPIAGKELTLMK